MPEENKLKKKENIIKIYQDATAKLLELQREQNQVLAKLGKALEDYKIEKIKRKISNS